MAEESNMFYSKSSKKFKQKIQSKKTKKIEYGQSFRF